jgi:subfamily B ATP-binding cassette protein MsbA
MPDNPAGTVESPNRSPKIRLASLIRPHSKMLLAAGIAVLCETGADVLEPWPVKVVIDNILLHKRLHGWIGSAAEKIFGHNPASLLNFAIAAVAAIAVVGAISSYIEKYLTTSVSQWVTHDLRRMLYNHIQRLSLAEYGERRTGDLISRVTDDIEAIQDFISSALLGMCVSALTLVGMIFVMFYVNWRFTLIALSVVPPLFLIVFHYTRQIKKASRAVRKKESELTSVVEEVLTSERVVKAFAREDYEVRRFENQSLENVETARRARSVKAKLVPIVETIVALGTILVLFYGTRFAMAGKISAGVLVVFLLYLGKMYKPMRDLSKMTSTVSKALVGYERVQEVLEVESRVDDLPRARRAPRFKGAIGFENVSFSYDGDKPVLRDINFNIEPGQVAAFVGVSGAGKTTIISLIPRFYDPTSGVVKVDGADVRRYRLKSLREQISFVLQETLLFRTSVWQNIAYGKPDASRREIVRAAELANAAEFIEEMPDGYDSLIGERGTNLSGGQRQRIAIARAIIRDAPILILDEPTTALDSASEQLVLEALERLMKRRTCVVIAHHLHTIRDSDVIFVVKDCELAERGTHEELLAAHGEYAHLHQLQVEGGGAEAVSTRELGKSRRGEAE